MSMAWDKPMTIYILNLFLSCCFFYFLIWKNKRALFKIKVPLWVTLNWSGLSPVVYWARLPVGGASLWRSCTGSTPRPLVHGPPSDKSFKKKNIEIKKGKEVTRMQIFSLSVFRTNCSSFHIWLIVPVLPYSDSCVHLKYCNQRPIVFYFVELQNMYRKKKCTVRMQLSVYRSLSKHLSLLY